jgi:hypothetical protein
VEKRFKNGRLTVVERRLIEGSLLELEQQLANSEDSTTINTSFVERLNLTLRQCSAYLRRRTTAHPRKLRRLAENLELVRAWYNFSRPHRGLKFGRVCRTPAQQAGLARRPVRLLEILRHRPARAEPKSATVRFRRGGRTLQPWQLAG